ncbi:hypothetical protein TREMEDRAFT_62638 [Tremella mesenterica DSM 1558]|uniref:uncharacterized protein n=1 Tax=Tremella mesenterica (strain ATCC 24925 / CBS 8224 / DSM 1558 / NBRC 9311 / NRRL Y-6157 / RJB 2259-6 / UBC 559-6) TaxID=578456 RepID=UPI0003F4A1CD|nr:uncharacterized protein TREMEDRAFT_62638 [Tremella mesenterica DSM 1558]EIW68920.1 hypothetical protein TREMEDRAFT_62638 [Tremella mesenterica DSM 1558]
MPLVFEKEIVYNYSPIHTLACLHRKYPNPFATHVFSVDTIDRSIDPDTGIIRSERLIGIQQGAPKWITRLFHLPPTAYVREVVFIDPSKSSATAMSVNLSLAQYVSCLELITYTPLPSPSIQPQTSLPLYPISSEKTNSLSSSSLNPEPGFPSSEQEQSTNQTLFSQRAYIFSAFPSRLIARRLEKASVDRFSSNAEVGKKGFEWVLQRGLVSGEMR